MSKFELANKCMFTLLYINTYIFLQSKKLHAYGNKQTSKIIIEFKIGTVEFKIGPNQTYLERI